MLYLTTRSIQKVAVYFEAFAELDGAYDHWTLSLRSNIPQISKTLYIVSPFWLLRPMLLKLPWRTT